MKISLDVECTPEEARHFLGLPDLTPLHDVYLSRLRAAMEQGITPDMLSQMVQGWAPMGETGLALWQQIIGQLGGRKSS